MTAATTYGPIHDQETLWSIATRLRPAQSISVQQVALALYRKNPQSFESANINSLKHNAILQTPTLAEMRATSYVQAVRTTRQHNLAWQNDSNSNTRSVPVARTTSSRSSEVAKPRVRTIVKVVEKPVVVVNNTVRRQQEAEIKQLKQQVSTLNRELASAKTQTSRLRQQLAVAKQTTSATTQTAMATVAASNPVSGSQPTQREIEIARQVQKLTAEVTTLESILEEKNNHISNLNMTLKNASETIKRQHVENQALADQLSTKTTAQNSAATATNSSTAQNTPSAPALKLAEVQAPATTAQADTDASTALTQTNNEASTAASTPPDLITEPESGFTIAPSVGRDVNKAVVAPNTAEVTAEPTETKAADSAVWSEEPSANATTQANTTLQPTNDVRTAPEPSSVTQDLKVTTPSATPETSAKSLLGTDGKIPPPSAISYLIIFAVIGFIAWLWRRSRRSKNLQANDFPVPEQERRRKTLRQDPVIPFDPKQREKAKAE
ncbi:FimV/HubP family polar landmark protein [Thiofilum flexile]|uniref:FimV/HubP family polar landmark protein n=1 Tax=Thiofilum flexile TaxID=125627 RepID=UPI0003A72D46|nr:FimV/HubP family polar landmark protein [Thiofilum flexile]